MLSRQQKIKNLLLSGGENKLYERGVLIGIYYRTFVGAFIGVVFMCLCNAAAKADEQMKDHINDKNKK